MVRWTKWCDREEIRELWNLRFDDSAPFVEWFFRERFSPDHSAVSFEDGHIVSSIQSYPFHVRIRNAILPCAVIAGVSTLPTYEGRGYMGQTMRFFMNGIADRGGIVLPYRPEILAMYQGFGHFPVSRTAYFHINDPTSLASDKTGVVFLNLRQDESAIHACYHRFSQRYSGIISRSLADVRLKISDYLADDACGVGVYEQDILTGYCIYFIHDTLYVEEFAANSPNDANRLFTALCQMASQAGKAVTGKLPPDIFLPAQAAQASWSLRPMGVMGVADVAQLLSAVGGNPSWRVAITDPVVAKNNGVFDFAGNRCEDARQPHLRLEAGRLVQFLCGYHTLEELTAQHLCTPLDSGAVRELDAAFPRCCCHIFDEY